jgi:hypothetical protein
MVLARRLDHLDIRGVQIAELLVEIPRQRVWVGGRHDLSKILRSADVESHPVMRSQVVGSIISSITSVRTRLASVWTIMSLRVSG